MQIKIKTESILFLNNSFNNAGMNIKSDVVLKNSHVFITIWLLRDDEKNKTLKNNVEDL